MRYRIATMILLCIYLLLKPDISPAMESAPKGPVKAEIIKQDKEIEEDLEEIPVKDENVGKEVQEEANDEKLVDEDA